LTHVKSAESRFYVLGVSRDFLSASHFLHIILERCVLPSNDMQVDARLGVGRNFAVGVHGNFTNAELHDRFPRFLDGPHGQRTCEYGGEESDKEDEEAELMKELEKIKKEREAEKQRKEMEEQAMREKQDTEAALLGNPLLTPSAAPVGVKRRWDEDVVFKNQSRDQKKHKKRFINDTIRSDFHRNFLAKYVQ